MPPLIFEIPRIHQTLERAQIATLPWLADPRPLVLLVPLPFPTVWKYLIQFEAFWVDNSPES